MSKAKGSGPAPTPAVCLLHLNFEPCPWCAQASVDAGLRSSEPSGEVEAATVDVDVPRRSDPSPVLDLTGEVEAATVDTTPRKRKPRLRDVLLEEVEEVVDEVKDGIRGSRRP